MSIFGNGIPCACHVWGSSCPLGFTEMWNCDCEKPCLDLKGTESQETLDDLTSATIRVILSLWHKLRGKWVSSSPPSNPDTWKFIPKESRGIIVTYETDSTSTLGFLVISLKLEYPWPKIIKRESPISLLSLVIAIGHSLFEPAGTQSSLKEEHKERQGSLLISQKTPLLLISFSFSFSRLQLVPFLSLFIQYNILSLK